MMASQNPNTKRHLALLLGLTLTVALTTAGPTLSYGKTRPPVEAGDPDIGNEKPRGAALASSLVVEQRELALKSSVRPRGWLRILIYATYELRAFYRLL